MPSLVGLQGLAAGLSTSTSLNSPLNLSVGSSSILHQGSGGHHDSPMDNSGCSTSSLAAGACSQMPQLILASGQLVQGVQGAQLLIPTSQGKLFYAKWSITSNV